MARSDAMNDMSDANDVARLERSAGQDSLGKREDYAHWFERGRVYQKAGRLIEAMICYQRTLQSKAHAVRARFRMGEVLHALGRDAEARAAWHAGLDLSPAHVPMLLALAEVAGRTGEYVEAIAAYRGVLAARPGYPEATLGLALSRLAQGDEAGYTEVAELLGARATPLFWTELARALAKAPTSPARTSLLMDIVSAHVDAMPPLMLACAAEEMIDGGETERPRDMLVRAELQASSVDDPETLRRLALVAARAGSSFAWAERYAQLCIDLFGGELSLLWPRRTAGTALRVTYLVAPGTRLTIDGVTIDTEAYLRAIVGAHARERIAATVCVVGETPLSSASALLPPEVPVAALGSAPDAALARSLAEADADALVDLVGLGAAIGPLLAHRPARTLWTYHGLAGANVAPLLTGALPAPSGGDAAALARHKTSLEAALIDACAGAPWFADAAPRTAAELGTAWRAAVAAHQDGDLDAALAGYKEVLAEQPAYAAGQYMLGTLLRDLGRHAEAGAALAAAVEAAPAYADARVALADLLREERVFWRAAEACEEGLRHAPNDASLWRSLGLARLAQRDGAAARRAFRRALSLAPTHAMTHYNEGVALQLTLPGLGDASRRSRNGKLALRAYQRALALDPQLVAADFNIGIIFREQGRPDQAIAAFEKVLARDPQHVPAHKALADTLQGERRLDDWLKAFDRFEAACPNAFPLLVMALEACQYRADFTTLEGYLNRLRKDEFKPGSETELADCLEELLFLLLYFDFEPESHFGLYRTYDVVAPRVYGNRVVLPAERWPGRIRLGYLSGDLRNHVMGKMMWPALERHDRERFELFFYSLSTESDEWTARYRGIADHFEIIAELPERDAADLIAADDLDILVDLSTHTRGAKPGILARKPARVQITHIASAGVVGLSAIDFKLTDDYADLPESQALQLETLLPMGGCVYPYRHIPPAADHPFHRDRLGIAPDAVVISAFVNPLKLSRRCLALWREVLERIPGAVLAISPMSPERRVVYGRLFSAAGIPAERVRVLPQGRDEAENQARYGLVDFTLDPMPYGGANGTLEALDMNVPVVTLVGRRHGERSTYSILANLGVTQTVATSGSEYVEIASRLATDSAFKAQVKAAIRAGMQRSPLTDMNAHTRHLEQAYLRALEQRYPEALAAVRNGSSSDVVGPR